MTKEFLEKIETLSLKFSSEKREEDINNVQSARHMIVGVYQGLKNTESQNELFRQLRESKGRSLGDLSQAINTFLTNLSEKIKSNRHIIGKLELKRRSDDNVGE